MTNFAREVVLAPNDAQTRNVRQTAKLISLDGLFILVTVNSTGTTNVELVTQEYAELLLSAYYFSV